MKGKLAELYLNRYLERLRAAGEIVSIGWYDADGQPDFEVHMPDGRKLRVECKNLRSDDSFSPERGCKVEIQKTRGGRDKQGRMTRGYKVDHFDLLAACTFNQTTEWEFRFIAAGRLERRNDNAELLKIMQPVPLTGEDKYWFNDFLSAAADARVLTDQER